jgi:hypothetical protein
METEQHITERVGVTEEIRGKIKKLLGSSENENITYHNL